MENILVIGANTRPIVCSLKNIGYNVSSADYFGCFDLKKCVTNFKSILSQKPYSTCGNFSKKFDPEVILNMASEMVDDADFIIYNSGISPSALPKRKLIGNRDINNVENKYKLYKHLKKSLGSGFKLPETYLVTDLEDALEIVDASESEKFLLKPLEGSGGVGIQNIDGIDPDIDIHEAILQEIVDGRDVSASVLSSGDEAITILTSEQLIGNKWLGQSENYGYCGNIVPYIQQNGLKNQLNNEHFEEIAADVVVDLKLIGSNGVDMIIKNGEVYVIEVNPRLQGTYEPAEAALGINIGQAHIMACRGELMEIPTPKNFAAKMIIFAKKRSIVGNLNIKCVNDIPAQNVIIEEGEPIATVLTSDKILEDTVYSAKKIVNDVYRNLTPTNP
jgi:predicted ATP-grasp superfamily ATP-dependent carboligase